MASIHHRARSHLPENMLLRHDLPSIASKRCQQSELRGRQHRELYSSASQTFKTGIAFSLTQGALDAGGITAISQGLSEKRATTPGHEVS